MLRYLTTVITVILSIFCNYDIFYSGSSCSMVLVLTSDTGQSSVLCITTHIMMISHLREFGNTSVHFCGEGKGESCEIQIMLETGISWLSEIVSCQDVTWILNITSHKSSTQLTQLTDHRPDSLWLFVIDRQTDRCVMVSTLTPLPGHSRMFCLPLITIYHQERCCPVMFSPCPVLSLDL